MKRIICNFIFCFSHLRSHSQVANLSQIASCFRKLASNVLCESLVSEFSGEAIHRFVLFSAFSTFKSSPLELGLDDFLLYGAGVDAWFHLWPKIKPTRLKGF